MISSIANNEKPFDGERNELIKQKKRNIRRNGPKRNKVRGGGGREESKRLKKEKSRRKEKEHKNSRRSSSISFRNNSKRDSKSTNRNFSIPDSSLANRNSPINYSEKRFRLSFEKFKKKINPLSTLAPKNYRTEECRRCPAEISEHIDVGDVYEQEVSAFEELFVMNSENNGQLFVNGKPFWTLKNERPPPEDSVPTKTTINDLVEGKWKLLRSIEIPNDLDEFGPLDVLKSRDFIYFNEPDRLISNTIRSIVLINDPVPAKEEDLFPIAPAYTEVNLMPPEYLYYYNRKNRKDKMLKIPFVSGFASKKKKNQ